ncbi:hypothetical protein PR048_020403 [Dryococelus australis]|uniref:Uncharacterized protein n=1 Tax=Dryococelus australis TaxID=614101 RepID=A0ABQ9H672_9NEOP|nr:hypothetical protein PR048_020403 [Dryococelus australis]
MTRVSEEIWAAFNSEALKDGRVYMTACPSKSANAQNSTCRNHSADGSTAFTAPGLTNGYDASGTGTARSLRPGFRQVRKTHPDAKISSHVSFSPETTWSYFRAHPARQIWLLRTWTSCRGCRYSCVVAVFAPLLRCSTSSTMCLARFEKKTSRTRARNGGNPGSTVFLCKGTVSKVMVIWEANYIRSYLCHYCIDYGYFSLSSTKLQLAIQEARQHATCEEWPTILSGTVKFRTFSVPLVSLLVSPPPIPIGFNPRPGHRIFASGNRAGRRRWSAGFPGDLPFPPPSHSGAAPYSPRPPSPALKTTIRETTTSTIAEDFRCVAAEVKEPVIGHSAKRWSELGSRGALLLGSKASFALPRKVVSYSAPTEIAPSRVSFRPPPPPVSPPRRNRPGTGIPTNPPARPIAIGPAHS